MIHAVYPHCFPMNNILSAYMSNAYEINDFHISIEQLVLKFTLNTDQTNSSGRHMLHRLHRLHVSIHVQRTLGAGNISLVCAIWCSIAVRIPLEYLICYKALTHRSIRLLHLFMHSPFKALFSYLHSYRWPSIANSINIRANF